MSLNSHHRNLSSWFMAAAYAGVCLAACWAVVSATEALKGKQQEIAEKTLISERMEKRAELLAVEVAALKNDLKECSLLPIAPAENEDGVRNALSLCAVKHGISFQELVLTKEDSVPKTITFEISFKGKTAQWSGFLGELLLCREAFFIQSCELRSGNDGLESLFLRGRAFLLPGGSE